MSAVFDHIIVVVAPPGCSSKLGAGKRDRREKQRRYTTRPMVYGKVTPVSSPKEEVPDRKRLSIISVRTERRLSKYYDRGKMRPTLRRSLLIDHKILGGMTLSMSSSDSASPTAYYD